MPENLPRKICLCRFFEPGAGRGYFSSSFSLKNRPPYLHIKSVQFVDPEKNSLSQMRFLAALIDVGNQRRAELRIPKMDVAGSIPVSRSSFK